MVSNGCSPAAAAGLQPLDTIAGYKDSNVSIPISSTQQVQDVVSANLDRPVIFEIKRGSSIVELNVTPRSNHPPGQGALGISLALTGVVSYPWYEAIWRGVFDMVLLTVNTAAGYYALLKSLLVHGTLIAEVSGPIGIASLTGQAARVGFNYLLQFVAMISVNLAVLNIIPFPALDGGRILLLIVDKLKGSPVHKKGEAMLNILGFYLLILLMVYVTYKDISKFFIK